MKQAINNTYTLLSTILAAFLFIYVCIFILYYVKSSVIFIDFDTTPKIFAEFKYIIPIFILTISNTLYLGKCAAIDNLKTLNYNYIKAIDAKKTRVNSLYRIIKDTI